MIPSLAALRHEAAEVWSRYRNEDIFRSWMEATWTPRIDAAYTSGEINIEGLQLAFNAVLSPIPYRRRFGRLERMTPAEARAELYNCGISDVDDDELPAVAREYGILVVFEVEVEA